MVLEACHLDIGTLHQEEQTERQPAEDVERMADSFPLGGKEIAQASVKQHPEELSY